MAKAAAILTIVAFSTSALTLSSALSSGSSGGVADNESGPACQLYIHGTGGNSLQCIQTSLAQFLEVWMICDHILLPSQYRS